jgi:large subunit ribosomal protein L10
MVERAAVEAGVGDLAEALKGPNAIAFSSDAVAPSRILAKFAKKHKMLVLKGGVVEGKVVNATMIATLASLPNREGMISMLLGLFQAPVRNFAYALSQVAEQKN